VLAAEAMAIRALFVEEAHGGIPSLQMLCNSLISFVRRCAQICEHRPPEISLKLLIVTDNRPF
jgi:hypothetical protein